MKVALVCTLALLASSLALGCSCAMDLGHEGSDAGLDARRVGPRTDECGNGLDDDENGLIDDFCPCAPGEMQRCFSGALGSNDIGACMAGTQTCVAASGTEWGDWGDSACAGEVLPATEACDGTDADCDGAIDEGCPCTDGAERACGEEFLIAPCMAGTQSCRGGTWSACEGAVGPSADVCSDAIDNDCDGLTNEGCECAYPLAPEVCRDAVDNDCDGTIDEPECTPDWPGDAGTPLDAGVGCVGASCRALASWAGPSIPTTMFNAPPLSVPQVTGVAVDADGTSILITPFIGTIDAGCGVAAAMGATSHLLHRLDAAGTCLWQRVLPGTLSVMRRSLGQMLHVRALESGDAIVIYEDPASTFGARGYVVVRHRAADGEPVWARRLWDPALTNSEEIGDLAVRGDAIFVSFSVRAEAAVDLAGARTLASGQWVSGVVRLEASTGAASWITLAQHNPLASVMGSGSPRLAITCDGDPILAAFASGLMAGNYGIPERRAELATVPVWDFGDGGFKLSDVAPAPGAADSEHGSALIVARLSGATGAVRWHREELSRGVNFPTPILRADDAVEVSYLANGGTYMGAPSMGVRFARFGPDGGARADVAAPIVVGRIDYYQVLPIPGGFALATSSGPSDGALHLFRFDETAPFESHAFSTDSAGSHMTMDHRRFYPTSCGTVMLAGAAADALTIDGVTTPITGSAHFVAQLR